MLLLYPNVTVLTRGDLNCDPLKAHPCSARPRLEYLPSDYQLTPDLPSSYTADLACPGRPQMQLFESRSGLEAAEAAKRQLQKDNRQLTVRREELQNKLNLMRKDMDQEGGEASSRGMECLLCQRSKMFADIVQLELHSLYIARIVQWQ